MLLPAASCCVEQLRLAANDPTMAKSPARLRIMASPTRSCASPMRSDPAKAMGTPRTTPKKTQTKTPTKKKKKPKKATTDGDEGTYEKNDYEGTTDGGEGDNESSEGDNESSEGDKRSEGNNESGANIRE